MSNWPKDYQSVEQLSIIFDNSSVITKSSQAPSKLVTHLNHGAKLTAGLHNMSVPLSHSTSTKASRVDSRIIWKPPIQDIDWTELHQTTSLRGLLALATQLRDGKDCAFALGSDTKPFSGGQSIIFVGECSDSIKYAFRLPYHTCRSTTRDWLFSRELRKSEGAHQQCAFPSYPRFSDLHLSDAQSHWLFPLFAYEWVEGKPLLWNDDQPCDQTYREKIITTLASFTIETACRLQKPGEF